MDINLYRYGSLMIIRNCNERNTDFIRKRITRIFKDLGFLVEISTNLKEVNFLHVTLDLKKEITECIKKWK